MKITKCSNEECKFDPASFDKENILPFVIFHDDEGMGLCHHHALQIVDLPVGELIIAAQILEDLSNDLLEIAATKEPDMVIASIINKVAESLAHVVEPPRIEPDEAN